LKVGFPSDGIATAIAPRGEKPSPSTSIYTDVRPRGRWINRSLVVGTRHILLVFAHPTISANILYEIQMSGPALLASLPVHRNSDGGVAHLGGPWWSDPGRFPPRARRDRYLYATAFCRHQSSMHRRDRIGYAASISPS
jgi:hypothetical protein